MENKTFKIEQVKRLLDTKEAENIVECILKVELSATPIGEGANAFIYIPEDESLQSVCLKKIKEKPEMVFNEIDQECEMQKNLKEIGVRTPLTLLSFTTKEKEDYLVMEKINGYSIKDIMKDSSLLPEKFDYNTFCKSLDEQIETMHNKGGIYHRDLHNGNVMIDEEGLPVIIDYGTAVKGSGSDNTYEDFVKIYNSNKKVYEFTNNRFKDDLESIRDIKDTLKVFINTPIDIKP